jgi:uncharacterized membrane-anchored protein
MTSPDPRARRERLVGLLLLGVALMLLATSATWFGSDRPGIGIGSLVLGVAVAGFGALMFRRSRAR